MKTNEKLAKLRKKMEKLGIDACVFPSFDPHGSEYVAPHYCARAFISGFTGSAGVAVVTQDKALVWADGRYYIQCEREIAGSDFEMMKWGAPGVPTYDACLAEILPVKATVAFDGATFMQSSFENLQRALEEKKISYREDLDLLEDIWTDRPALAKGDVFYLDEVYTGASIADHLKEVREKMAEKHLDYLLLPALADVAWLFNIRGADVPCSPVVYSYAIVARDPAKGATIFLDQEKLVKNKVDAKLKEAGIEIRPYEEIVAAIQALPASCRIQVQKDYTNRHLFQALPPSAGIVGGIGIVDHLKALKNPTQQKNVEKAYIKDGVVLVRLQKKVEEALDRADRGEGAYPTELDVSRWEEELKEKEEHFLDLSFTTISAYGANAAMMHYDPTKAEKETPLGRDSFLLLDSGTQYLEGTTDITRTFCFQDPDKIPQQMKQDYTYTLKSSIMLMTCQFIEGTTGSKLDAICRYPLWQIGHDYKCGTGHGVGFVLNVHEGPQRLGFAPNAVPLEEGMITTVEPGVYLEGQYGIRIENDLFVRKAEKTESGQFFRLHQVCYVPIDKRPLDPSLLSPAELAWLNAYHEECYRRLAPSLTEEERAYLRDLCAPL